MKCTGPKPLTIDLGPRSPGTLSDGSETFPATRSSVGRSSILTSAIPDILPLDGRAAGWLVQVTNIFFSVPNATETTGPNMKGAYAWVFDDIEVFEEPLRWLQPQGCVVWANMLRPLLEMIHLRPRELRPRRLQLLQLMEAAQADRRQELEARRRVDKRKRGS
eukprot:Skav201884  [mRNA]  locus=scaffold550:310021:312573:- [translate_table: standard]